MSVVAIKDQPKAPLWVPTDVVFVVHLSSKRQFFKEIVAYQEKVLSKPEQLRRQQRNEEIEKGQV